MEEKASGVYHLILITGETDAETPAYQRALNSLVQQIASEHKGCLAEPTTVKTFLGPDLPDPDEASIQGYVRGLQMRLGIGLLAFDYEFRQKEGFSFMIAYMKR